MKAMSNFFGVPRASYYAWVERAKRPDKDNERMRLGQDAWKKSRKVYGYRRVTLALQQQGHVFPLMRKLTIRSVARKRKPYKKASQMESHHRYQNVLDRDFTAREPNQKWVTDIS